MKAVIAREQKMPANFAAARSNLKDVPKIYTEIALEQIPGIISFFQNDVPAAFKSVTEPKLLAEFKASNDKVIFELQRYQDFLKNDLLPHFEWRLPPRSGEISQETAVRRDGRHSARPTAADRL